MRLYILFISGILASLLFLFSGTKDSYAQSCNGTFQCIQETYNCTGGCYTVSDPLCQCSQQNIVITESCSILLDRGGCSGSTANAVCTQIYTPSAGMQSYNCSSYTCSASNCFNRTCSNGSGCQCYGVCSNNVCVEGGVVPGTCPTPTPTPQPCNNTCGTSSPPGSNCTYNSSGDAWCRAQPNGNQNAYCWNCSGGAAATSTPTPTPTPTPTSTSGGGGTGSGGSPTCAVQCPPSAACYSACTTCDGPWPNFSNCGGGSSCMENGGACYLGDGSGCCSGYCSLSNTCESPPTCSGCTFWNGSYCQDNNSLCSGGQICSNGTCINPTYTISGNVFIDTNNDGVKQVGEQNYQGATVTRSGGFSTLTNSSGNYSFSGLSSSIYSISLTIPSGYQLSSGTINPRSVYVPPDQSNINFGIRLAPPVCSPTAIIPGSSTVNPGASTTLNVSNCTNVENPNDNFPPPPVTWNPDTGGNSPAPTVNPVNPNPSCAVGVCTSTTTWTAPNCPTSTINYTPQVTLNGPGGTTNYTTTITVPATYTVTANVRSVINTSSCSPTDGSAYNDGAGGGAHLNLNGGSVNQNQTTNPVTGQASFTCIPGGSYQLTLSIPSGYTLTGTAVNGSQSLPGSNPISLNPLSANTTTTFCIAPIKPWFQTDKGDVRFLNLTNPVPAGKLGSTDATYPGIYYSSNSNVNVGFGTASIKNWVVNNEYSYNADTENRNGGMSYDFYKARASQLGTTITQIDPNIFDQSQITGSGIFEAPGDLTINLYNHVNGRRVVLLVDGNVTINAPITIPQNQGVFILAAKGNITVSKTVGVAYNTDYVLGNSNTHSLDGYYTAQGSIVLDGDTCPDGITSDLRLNVGGALIANALKPFSTTGTGTIQNKRSVCTNSITYPSLFVASRPDFLTQLTDFYKTSYTKWQEVAP